MKKRMKKIYHSCEEESEVLIESASDSQSKLNKAKNLIGKLTKNRYIMPLINDSATVVFLLSDFIKRKYSIKKSVAVGLLASVLYFVFPVDAIPDFTPVIGFLDDALILVGAFSKFRAVIDDYKNFVDMQNKIPEPIEHNKMIAS